MIDTKIIKKPKKGGAAGSGGFYSPVASGSVGHDCLKWISRLFVPVDTDGNELPWDTPLDDIFAVRSVKGIYTHEFLSARGLNPFGDGGAVTPGVTALSALTDVLLGDDLADGQSLVYDGTNWVNRALQIPDLTGYATEQWVLDKNYLTDHQDLSAYAKLTDIPSLNGYATEQWVLDKNYLTQHQDISGKVDKETGKGLSSNDFTDALLNKLNGIEAGANKYVHPTGGANTAISAANGKVLSSITVDSLGHVSSVGSKTLVADDIPSLDWSKITTGKPTTLAGYGITDAYTKTEADDRYVNVDGDTMSGLLTLNAGAKVVSGQKLIIGNCEISWDADKGGLKFSKGIYSEEFVSARGINPNGSSGGGSAWNLMRSWPSADPGQNTNDALGANLGWELKQGKLDKTEAATLYQPVGNYLTAHQPIRTLTIQRNGVTVDTFTPTAAANKTINISDVASAATLSSHTGNSTVHITATERTAWNNAATNLSAILGSDASGVIDKWDEIVAFLDTYTEADTLANLLSNKADKTVQIIAGSGLTGGGTLAADRTLSLATSGVTAGTYTKLTVDSYGRATAGASLVASDIPSLDWSKITTGKPTTLAGYGITDAYTKTEADDRYVNVDGDTMSGLLTAKTGATHTGVKFGNTYITAIDGNVIFQNNSSIRFGTDAWDYNQWAGLKYDHTNKTIHLGIADKNIFTANAAQTNGKVNLVNCSLQIGGCEISWDATNGGLKFSKGIYSEGFVSARGLNSSGGASGGFAFNLMRSWPSADPGKNTNDALGANLGWELYQNKLNATQTAIEGLLTGTITSHSHNTINVQDVRSASRGPNYFGDKNLSVWFNNTGTPDSNWWSGIHVKGWAGSYAAWELAGIATSSTPNNNLYFRTGINDTWNAWQTVVTSANIGSYAITAHQSLAAYLKTADANAAYVTSLGIGTEVNNVDHTHQLAWVKNGTTNYLTIPYATRTDYLRNNTALTYGASGVQWFNISGTQGCVAKVNDTPTTAWWHILRFNHANNAGYYTDLAVPFNANSLYYKNVRNGVLANDHWVRIVDDLNYSTILDGRYVKKSGDTMTGLLHITSNGVTFDIGALNSSWVHLYSTKPCIFNKDLYVQGNLYAGSSYNQLVWHAGNDGSGSGLDADLLDGYHYNTFNPISRYGTKAQNSGWYKINIKPTSAWMLYFRVRLYQNYEYLDIDFSGYNYGVNYWHAPKARLVSSSLNNVTVHFGYDSAWNLWVAVPASYYTGISIVDVVNGYEGIDPYNLFTISLMENLTGTIQNTQTLSRGASISDNVASATKLQTARSIWGQSFDGSGNVNGTFYFTNSDATMKIYGVDGQYENESVAIQTCFDGQDPLTSDYVNSYTSRCVLALQPRAGRVAINKTTADYPLDVNGQIRASGWLRQTGNAGWYNETHAGGWYMTDTTWIRNYNNKSLYMNTATIRTDYLYDRQGYAGSSWNNGYGAYNTAITNNSSQTPLLVAYRAGQNAAITGENRLFALELLNSGGQLNFGFKGAAKFSMTSEGKFEATSIKIGSCTITYEDGGLRFSSGIYSDSFVSARGLNTSGGASGGFAFNLMRSWPSADPGPNTNDALGANLGWELYQNKLNATQTAIEGLLTGTITSHSHNTINVQDVRGASRGPNYFGDKNLSVWFNNTGTPDSNWWSGIHVKGWTGAYAAWELAGIATSSTPNNNLYFRTGINDTWNAWQTVVTSANIGSYALTAHQSLAAYMKTADANAAYVTSLGIGTVVSNVDHTHQLAWVKNGTTNYLTIPYATRTTYIAATSPIPATSQALTFYGGQPTIGSNSGNAFKGSSPTFNLWSFPDGATATNATNANVQVLRFVWSNIYFHDIFVSPNMAGVWHRSVINGAAGDWERFLTSANYANTLDTQYVKKSGDTMTGMLNVKFNSATLAKINTTGTVEVGIGFLMSDVSKGWVGYNATSGAILYNYACGKSMGIKDDGTPHYSGNTLWHAGNDGAGSGLDADLLDGYHRSNLFNGTYAWISATTGLNQSIEVGGDANTFYPVIISVNGDKQLPTRISVWKNLGSKTPASYPDTHPTGKTASMWLLYEGRNTQWDGNGGFFRTLYRAMPYTSLCAKAENNSNVHGGLIVWLRGGGCQYNVSCTNPFSVTVALSEYLLGTSGTNRYTVAPTTTMGNLGVFNIGFALYGNASSANKLYTARTLWGQSFDGSANVSGNMTGVGELYATGWLRTYGARGWYNQDYQGGIYMTDANWIRTYNNKPLLVECAANNGWGINGHRLNAVFAGSSHASILLALQGGSVAYGICANVNGNMYFGKRTNGTYTTITDDAYLMVLNSTGLRIGDGNGATCRLDVLGNQRLGSTVSGAGNDVHLELWRGTNASWKLLNAGGILKFQSNYTDKAGDYFDCLTLDYNTGNAAFKGQVCSTNANAFRMVYGGYGSFFRNDGSKTYLLLTDKDDPYGGWNNLFPLTVNNATGDVSMNKNLSVSLSISSPEFKAGAEGSSGFMKFLRKGFNYITAPEDGYLAFVPGGLNTTEANSSLVIHKWNVRPGKDITVHLGSKDNRWASFYTKGAIVSEAITLDLNAKTSTTVIQGGSIELYHNTPYIDFHFNNADTVDGSKKDFTTRIWEEAEGRLCVLGTLRVSVGMYTPGYVSARGQNTASDARLKRVLAPVELSVADIAKAPSVRFVWKADGVEDVGSIAQYWRKLIPQLAPDMPDGSMGLQYGKAALLGLISVARKTETLGERLEKAEISVEWLRRRVESLERENCELKRKLLESR